jgi:hypothetical protein
MCRPDFQLYSQIEARQSLARFLGVFEIRLTEGIHI